MLTVRQKYSRHRRAPYIEGTGIAAALCRYEYEGEVKFDEREVIALKESMLRHGHHICKRCKGVAIVSSRGRPVGSVNKKKGAKK